MDITNAADVRAFARAWGERVHNLRRLPRLAEDMRGCAAGSLPGSRQRAAFLEAAAEAERLAAHGRAS